MSSLCLRVGGLSWAMQWDDMRELEEINITCSNILDQLSLVTGEVLSAVVQSLGDWTSLACVMRNNRSSWCCRKKSRLKTDSCLATWAENYIAGVVRWCDQSSPERIHDLDRHISREMQRFSPGGIRFQVIRCQADKLLYELESVWVSEGGKDRICHKNSSGMKSHVWILHHWYTITSSGESAWSRCAALIGHNCVLCLMILHPVMKIPENIPLCLVQNYLKFSPKR